MINDDNIDLTEHRDFRDSLYFVEGINLLGNKQFWQIIKEKEQKRIFGFFPWNVYPINDLYKYDGLVALGNSKQRAETIKLYCWGTKDSIVCDCCGKEYKKIPWETDSGLCRECKIYDKKHRRINFPWDNRLMIQ